MQDANTLVLDAANIGLRAMHKADDDILQQMVLDFHKKGTESGWSVTDKDEIAVVMAMGNSPQAVSMSFQREYAERYDWLIKEFTDWAFTYMTTFLYYHDYDLIDEQTKDLYRQGM